MMASSSTLLATDNQMEIHRHIKISSNESFSTAKRRMGGEGFHYSLNGFSCVNKLRVYFRYLKPPQIYFYKEFCQKEERIEVVN